ncbi:MAG: hypothetical protein WCA26_01340 [Xanthobacteraceae bacterium]
MALGFRHPKQIRIGEALRALEDRSSNENVVVLGQLPYDTEGALLIQESLIDSSNRAFASISAMRRLKTSSKSSTWSSLNEAALPMKRLVMRSSISARRS